MQIRVKLNIEAWGLVGGTQHPGWHGDPGISAAQGQGSMRNGQLLFIPNSQCLSGNVEKHNSPSRKPAAYSSLGPGVSRSASSCLPASRQVRLRYLGVGPVGGEQEGRVGVVVSGVGLGLRNGCDFGWGRGWGEGGEGRKKCTWWVNKIAQVVLRELQVIQNLTAFFWKVQTGSLLSPILYLNWKNRTEGPLQVSSVIFGLVFEEMGEKVRNV